MSAQEVPEQGNTISVELTDTEIFLLAGELGRQADYLDEVQGDRAEMKHLRARQVQLIGIGYGRRVPGVAEESRS